MASSSKSKRPLNCRLRLNLQKASYHIYVQLPPLLVRDGVGGASPCTSRRAGLNLGLSKELPPIQCRPSDTADEALRAITGPP
jgi:hypothetical protein